ncbi:MAG: hypothetical protein JKY29_11740, partial [Gammaproteobacteria bacterium]|nr:hypothetical protein [Gammaproteobacteria bacterium]
MMRLHNMLKLGFLMAVMSVAMLPLTYVNAGEEQRAPPAARTSGTLGPAVLRAISEIQEMLQP